MTTAAKGKKHIDELHLEHTLWMSNMKFYHEEVYDKICCEMKGEFMELLRKSM